MRQPADHSLDEDSTFQFGISKMSAADYATRGYEWAIASSQQVLIQADSPRLETVQACLNLCRYWFSHGDPGKALMHQRKI